MDRTGAVVREAVAKGLITEEEPFCVLYDLECFKGSIKNLFSTFPSATLHTVACKANPLRNMLQIAADLGAGCEVASYPELVHALSIFQPQKIVFDSPSKTIPEIQFALEKGVLLNADNLQELERIDKCLKNNHSSARVGLRINPQTGAGAIVSTSTATSTSKFGYAFEHKQEIIDAYLKYPWLQGVHVHTGSQGCGLSQLVESVKKVLGLVAEINSLRASRNIPPISIFDIGGGHPVDYEDTTHGPTNFSSYFEQLKTVPNLWDGKLHVITEFGRSLSAAAGIAISKVEYTKKAGGALIATVHYGADFLLRNAYRPTEWKHQVSIYDAKFNKKIAEENSTQNIILAGPLCFSGDIITTNNKLPVIETGDFAVIHDVGAYTLSMWSRYNSRPAPAVYGFAFTEPNNTISFSVLKHREPVSQVISFWG